MSGEPERRDRVSRCTFSPSYALIGVSNLWLLRAQREAESALASFPMIPMAIE